jgi:hypothetical protein
MSNYTKDNLLTISKEDVPIGSLAIKVGNEVFPLTIGKGGSGFQLVKVTDYYPAREGFTAPGTVTFSGLGTVESEWGGDSADLSDVNGDYVVTEDTKYKKGLARVYKQRGGKYYLCGYDPSGMDWSEYEAHWYISETVGGYGWSSKMSCYNSKEVIPSGSVNWYNENIGEFAVTTAITNTEVTTLEETYLAKSITAFNAENSEWTEGDTVDISSYSVTPQTNGVYFAQDGKLIGQHIDRELHIPENGLVRRWKAVDGHFVDTVWGTEMMPSGDISYDELGYCKNSAAPMAKTIGSWLGNYNTLSPNTSRTYNVFVKPMYNPGNRTVWNIGNEGAENYEQGPVVFQLNADGTIYAGSCGRSIKSNGKYSPNKWNMLTLTATYSNNPTDTYYMDEMNLKLFVNGKFSGEFSVSGDKVLSHYYSGGNYVYFFANSNYTGETFIGQIDEACVWDRILTDEEIADMAKGLEGFNWDVPVKPYEQEQPLLYAPLTDSSDTLPSGQHLSLYDTDNRTPLSDSLRNGAFWNYWTTDEGLVYAELVASPLDKRLFTSGSYSVCVDLYIEKYTELFDWQNSARTASVINSRGQVGALDVYTLTGSQTIRASFKNVKGNIEIPTNTWKTLIVRRYIDGRLQLFVDGILDASGVNDATYPWEYTTVSGLNRGTLQGAIRNIRVYNRAITDEEIAELSGVKETE